MYNPKTVEAVTGEVIRVVRAVPIRGMSFGVHRDVRTEKGTVSVHLGPAWFIDRQEIAIAPKDRIEVTGSKVMLDGNPS